MMPPTIGTPALWTAFGAGVLVLLVLDLGVFHRRTHVIGWREALVTSLLWIGVALLYTLYIGWRFRGAHPEAWKLLLTGYLVEEALSVDNLFVFIIIFAYFSTPKEFQHRVLFWGILGAVVMRGIFIFAGTLLIARFTWLIPVFGGILVFTGIKLLAAGEVQVKPERNPVLRLFKRFIPVATEYQGTRFLMKADGRWVATPLLVVLVVVEATDVVFALDSIPAVFVVTRDPFLVFTSNILAILGLRALYFLIAGMMEGFRYLKYGLGVVLIFIGAKGVAEAFHVNISIGQSLAAVAAILGLSIVASLILPKKEADAPADR